MKLSPSDRLLAELASYRRARTWLAELLVRAAELLEHPPADAADAERCAARLRRVAARLEHVRTNDPEATARASLARVARRRLAQLRGGAGP